MNKIALFIKHKSLPGKRDEMKKVWERHMQPEIAFQPKQLRALLVLSLALDANKISDGNK